MAEPTVFDDPEHVGHAILRLLDAREIAPAVALRLADMTFLGADGRRGRGLHLFASEAIGPLPTRDFRLGPDITAHVREAEIVTLLEADGGVLGTIVWEGIRVPPLAGVGPRLSAGGGKTGRAITAAPMFAARATDANPSNDLAATVETVADSAHGPMPRRGRTVQATALVVVPLLALLLALAAVLTGLVGWRLEPAEATFAGLSGGVFAPAERRIRLVLAWYAKPFLASSPVPADAVPGWVVLRQDRAGYGWALDLAPAEPARFLASGPHEARLSLQFPLRTIADALIVSLLVEPAKPMPPVSAAPPPAPNPPPAPTKVPVTTIDDAACDRLAGNRFDGDHPATAGFTDEIFTLSQANLDVGLAVCDPGTARSGADRRFAVQRGRLLAHLALTRLAARDIAGATSDMDAAVALWRHGDELGSAYAANLLGAYHSGTFNRPSHAFVAPDDRAADAFWKKAMEGGNIVAERNYAAQLLAGKGVAADPARAVALLRDAAGKGDLHASGVLGMALYTGSPPGVALDKMAAWPLVVAAQCVNPSAAALVEHIIAVGAQPASIHRDCR